MTPKFNDPRQGSLLRDEAIDQVEEHAQEEWKKAAYNVVVYIAKHRVEFTTDAVWSLLDRISFVTHENRAMGAIMRRAANRGVCVRTDRTTQSVRPECHRRPIRIWRSLMCQK